MNTLLEEIKNKLTEDVRFHYKGKGANQGVWETKDEEGKWFKFKKNIGQKGYGHVRIFLFKEDDDGVEIKVEIYVPSLCEDETFFEGFVETGNDFDRLMIMLGIN